MGVLIYNVFDLNIMCISLYGFIHNIQQICCEANPSENLYIQWYV